MKILMVSDDLFPGGAAKHVVDLSNNLVKRGHTVTVASGSGSYRMQLSPEIVFHHLPVYNDRDRKMASGLFWSFVLLQRLIRQGEFDLIHSHKRVTNALISFARRPPATVHITSVHNMFTDKKTVTRFGDYTICCSAAVRTTTVKTFGCSEERSGVVYNGIDPIPELPEPEKEKIRGDLRARTKTIISSIGMFAPYKDRKTLIKAIDLLRTQPFFSKVLFVLQGSGEERSVIEQMILALGLTDSISILPHNFPVASLMNVSEFLILNSRSGEGFPLVILEAASIGKMHIGTDIGGIAEFIDHEETGILIPPGDPAALAEAITEMIGHPDAYRRMGVNAQKKFFLHHTLEIMTDSIEDIYRRTIR